jgi:hypothetical protein
MNALTVQFEVHRNLGISEQGLFSSAGKDLERNGDPGQLLRHE